jgi:hypothetical protein
MAFALPMKREDLSVSLSKDNKNFHVNAINFDGDLTIAEQRRKWFKKSIGANKFTTINEILDNDKPIPTCRKNKVLIVHGAEFDSDGHEGQLKLEGAEDHLSRYSKTIRRLRNSGYKRVIVTTDHGFFHWQPDADEVQEKPDGEILWTSRRAIIGNNLRHSSAIHLPVIRSDFEALVPRSINAFKTYGGLGFFHGGATLQEILIPVVVACWPAKATKVEVVLKPVGQIASEAPRVQVQAGGKGQAKLFTDTNELARKIFIKVKDPSKGKLVFRHSNPATIEPEGDPITISLQLVDPRPNLPYGAELVVEVIDADDEEILDREEIKLKVDIDEW